MRRATNALNNLRAGIEEDKRAAAAPDQVTDTAEPKPTLVEVHQPAPSTMDSLRNFIVPILSPIGTTVIIIVFVIFILIQQADLRNRFIRLSGIYDLQRTTKAIDDAGRRLSRFLLRQAIINSAFATIVAGGLWFIGIPGAFLWGLLAGLFRFIPYVGTIAAVICPLLLALSIDPGWSTFFWTLALFVVLEPAVGYGIEPIVYGQSVGLSPVAVVTSAVFWTSLWGPVGLLLATPLTVCLVVLGRHVEGLSFLEVMLSDKDPLTAAQIFYQRILEGKPEEALQYAEDCMKEVSLEHYYENVVLEGLRLAQIDVWRGVVSPESFDASLDEFFSQYAEQNNKIIGKNFASSAPSLSVLCVAGPSLFDRHISVMLNQLLNERGVNSRVMTSVQLEEAAPEFTDAIVSSIDSTSLGPLRLLVRNVREKRPQLRITLGLWMFDDETAAAQHICKVVRADCAGARLAEVLNLSGTSANEAFEGEPSTKISSHLTQSEQAVRS